MRFASIFLGLLLVSCASPKVSIPTPGKSRDFAALTDDYINGYLRWRPQSAVALGLHQYDGLVTDYSAESIDQEISRLHRFKDEFGRLERDVREGGQRYDLQLIKSSILNELFTLEEMHSYQKNPMSYLGPFDLTIYIKRDFAPLEDRVRSLMAIENQAVRIFTQARNNLEASLARPYVETAIEMAQGVVDFLSKDLTTALSGLTNQTLKARFEVSNADAISELGRFIDYLKVEKLPGAQTNYALGTAKYRKMLSAEMIDLAPEHILELGLRELRNEQARFAAAAKLIDPASPPHEVFKAIQRDHPTAAGLIPDTRKTLEAIRQFVVDHRIVTIPSEERANVEETPQFARATSFASMDTPGPFETKARQAFYYVTPVEKNWPEKQKEEWLTAFNYYTTDVVSIHEAYPGHYVQFLSLNASKASRAAKIFSGYAFVEGWAHYTEQMMLDEGFGSADPVKQAKYRLAQSDEALLRLCRLCVSIKTHCQGMSLEDATKFFEDNCYYEQKPSYQEALRGTFDPGYLYYTVGKLQILKLRDDYRRQEGTDFSLQRFHDEMLQNGCPPIRLLREILLKEKQLWPEVL